MFQAYFPLGCATNFIAERTLSIIFVEYCISHFKKHLQHHLCWNTEQAGGEVWGPSCFLFKSLALSAGQMLKQTVESNSAFE